MDGYSAPSLADWNADGWDDLIVGERTSSGQGKVRVYLNREGETEPIFDTYVYAKVGTADLSVAGSSTFGVSARFVDWDGDDLPDLVLGLADGTVRVALNNGTEEEPRFAAPQPVQLGAAGAKANIDVGDGATVDVADYNDDWLLDLIVGAQDGRVHVFLNTADSGTPEFLSDSLVKDGTANLSVPGGRSSVSVYDLDEDGLPDLLSGNANGQLVFYANFGTYEQPEFAGYELVRAAGSVIDLPDTARSQPFATDYDGDGYTDLLVGASDGLVRRYRVPSEVDDPTGVPGQPFTFGFVVDGGSAQNPWVNPAHPLDVNQDGRITPLDALVVINYLNDHGSGSLPIPPVAPLTPPPFLDCSGNGDVTPLDALMVINELNAHGPSVLPEAERGEGEGGDGPRATACPATIGVCRPRRQMRGSWPPQPRCRRSMPRTARALRRSDGEPWGSWTKCSTRWPPIVSGQAAGNRCRDDACLQRIRPPCRTAPLVCGGRARRAGPDHPLGSPFRTGDVLGVGRLPDADRRRGRFQFHRLVAAAVLRTDAT